MTNAHKRLKTGKRWDKNAVRNYFLADTALVLDPAALERTVRHALVEDIGHGDITTHLTVSANKKITAAFVTREPCVVCGLPAAAKAFELTDGRIRFKALVKEGSRVPRGAVMARVSGPAAGIITAERVALNLLCLLSGVATKTREYVKHIEPYKTKITDTRKTIPGLRDLQKYAVRIGGGHSHRMGLDEMILIKDNHLRASDGLRKMPSVPKGFKIEVEVNSLDEFRHALSFKPDVIMLDNMSIVQIKKAVLIRNKTPFTSHHPMTRLEASGGINFATVRKVAAAGVDIISIGALTHSVKAVDIGLDIV